MTAVLKAHGVKPEWKSYNWTALTPACQEAFKRINLHWHDLRHEYASRLVERGVPLAQVRDLLGHASITTTERYDNQKLENLQAAVLKFESGKTFDANVSDSQQNRIDTGDKISSFFQEETKVSGIDDQNRVDEIEANLESENDLDDWLGGRDSNPDTVVQRETTTIRSVLTASVLSRFSAHSFRPAWGCGRHFVRSVSHLFHSAYDITILASGRADLTTAA